jgi:hypothetical protein
MQIRFIPFARAIRLNLLAPDYRFSNFKAIYRFKFNRLCGYYFANLIIGKRSGFGVF